MRGSFATAGEAIKRISYYIAFAIALVAPARAESVQVTISNLHAIKIVVGGIIAPGVIA